MMTFSSFSLHSPLPDSWALEMWTSSKSKNTWGSDGLGPCFIGEEFTLSGYFGLVYLRSILWESLHSPSSSNSVFISQAILHNEPLPETQCFVPYLRVAEYLFFMLTFVDLNRMWWWATCLAVWQGGLQVETDDEFLVDNAKDNNESTQSCTPTSIARIVFLSLDLTSISSPLFNTALVSLPWLDDLLFFLVDGCGVSNDIIMSL